MTPAGWDDWANVLVLCDGDRLAHALTWVGLDPDNDPAAKATLGALTHAAACIVLEQYYFDIDHRSEAELVQATQFAPAEVTVDRLHYFSPRYDMDTPLQEYLRDAHQQAGTPTPSGAPVYLGYTILRPRRDARIGRSLISPWAQVAFRAPTLDGEEAPHEYGYAEGEPMRVDVIFEQVRTAVPESVNVYGFDFRAVGIPFMEQDGYILRCAHVSAWICHYSAVLRGLIPRRTTGQIHRAGHTTLSIARRYPSTGVSPVELAAILREVNLAPEALGQEELMGDRKRMWADRDELFQRSDALTEAITAAGPDFDEQIEERDRLWIRENLTATLCRYLNSGLPIILVRQLISHTQVVVGYLRASDLTKDPAAAALANHSDVTAFLVSDDQDGPFKLVYVDELVDELINEPASNEIFVPLPDAVWVSGDMAERVGAAQLLRIAETRVERLDAWQPSENYDGGAITAFKAALESDADTYTIRTYVTAGTDFKRSCAKRMEDDQLMVSALTRLQLPRFVWVCEVIDRSLRAERKPSVVATIVLDATQLIHNPIGELPTDDVDPLFVHLPTLFYAPSYQVQTMGYTEYNREDSVVEITSAPLVPDDADADEPDEDEDDWFWHTTDIRPYYTGRWGHHLLSQLSAATVASFAKGAVAPR